MEADNPRFDELNRQTGRIAWPELRRHFAAGSLLYLEAGQDLVSVAVALAEDRSDDVAALLESGALQRVSDPMAKCWEAAMPEFWAVVVAPWVVIQSLQAADG